MTTAPPCPWPPARSPYRWPHTLPRHVTLHPGWTLSPGQQVGARLFLEPFLPCQLTQLLRLLLQQLRRRRSPPCMPTPMQPSCKSDPARCRTAGPPAGSASTIAEAVRCTAVRALKGSPVPAQPACSGHGGGAQGRVRLTCNTNPEPESQSAHSPRDDAHVSSLRTKLLTS